MSAREHTAKRAGRSAVSVPSRYMDLLSTHPLLINGVQSALISVLSIHCSKYFSSHPRQHSQLHESASMFIVSFCIITPCIYNFNKRVIARMRRHILVKVAVDQFIFSPILTFAILFSRQILLDVLNQKNISIVGTCVKSITILPTILVHGWLFWLPVKFLSLQYVPFKLQIVFSSIVAFVWNIVLSVVLR